MSEQLALIDPAPPAIERGAEISACGRYRYLLWRRWDKEKPSLIFIMLNPSTADAETDDATVRVCIGRARRMGFGGIRVLNLFAFRATDRSFIRHVAEPIGPDNDRVIMKHLPVLCEGEIAIAAWGDDGAYRGRDRKVISLASMDHAIPLHAVALTKSGNPRHPLRVPYATEPFLWKKLR